MFPTTYDQFFTTNTLGRLIAVSSSSAVANWITAYDALGRVASSFQVIGGQSYTFSYSYNLADALTSTTYPSNRVVTTTYDGANRPSGLSGTFNSLQTQYLADISYAPHGGWAGQTYNRNQMGRLFTYNNRLQPTEMKDGIPTFNGSTVASVPNPLLDLQYFWGSTTLGGSSTTNNGNLTGQQIITQNPTASFNQSYTYDTLNRIASAGENGSNGWSEVFNADRYGNLWLSNITGNNFPTQSLMPTGLASFSATTNHLVGTSYDAAGNQTVLGGNTLAYDAEGRQISAQISGSPPVTVTYAYDGLGERVTKSVAGGLTTTYVHDVFGNLAEEYTTGGTASAPPCTTCYLSWDHLGSTRMMTDQNGNVVARHDYLPFGVEIPAGFAGRTSAWGTADNVSAKFTGQERDAETGLDFFSARYMSSAQGRFTSPDPLGIFVADATNPQSWNHYSYVGNNPLAFVDPTGTCTVVNGQYQEDDGDPCPPPPDTTITVNGGDAPPVPEYWQDTDDDGNTTFVVYSFYSPTPGPSGQPPTMDPTRRKLACFADVGVNAALSTFLPTYGLISAVSGYEFHPFQSLVSGKLSDLIGQAEPFGRVGTAANTVANWPDMRNAGVGAQRAADLVARNSFPLQSLARQNKLIQNAVSAERLANIAKGFGKATAVLAVASYAIQAYECTQ